MSNFLSSKSCSNCRRLHRKCDRRLPCCSLCHERRKTCVYETGKRHHTEHPRPYPNLIVTPNIRYDTTHTDKTIDIMQSSFMTLFTDIWYKMVFEMPVMSPDKLLEILQYMDLEQMGQANLITAPNDEELALIYAMLADLYVNKGHESIAQLFFEKSRNLVMNGFERVSVSFLLATCFSYLALYCAIQGDKHRADFFYRNIKGYLDYAKDMKQKHPCHELLEQSYYQREYEFFYDNDFNRKVKGFILQACTLQDFYRNELGKSMPYNNIFKILSESGFSADIVSKTRVNQTDDHYLFNDESIGRIAAIFSSFFDQLIGLVPDTILSCKKMAIIMCLEGARLQFFLQMGNLIYARAVSDSIAQMTTELYFGQHYVLVGPIAMAANCHLQCLNATTDNTEKRLILDRLREELVAITKITEHNKYMRSQYSELLVKITNNIRSEEDNLMIQSFIPSESVPVQTSYNFNNTMSNFASVIQDKVVNVTSNETTSSMAESLYDGLATPLSFVDDVFSLDAVDDFFQGFIDL